MKKAAFILLFIATAFSCSKEPVVEVRASFKVKSDVLQIGEELVIENTSVVRNDILAFCKWEYGNEDGTSVLYSLECEGISFSEPGFYTITLTAYAEQGAGQDSYSKQILVVKENDKPWADFSCPASARVGEEVLFEDKSVDNVGGIKSWTWNIGGVASSYQSPLIVFDSPATGVAVTLIVKDAYNATGSITKYIDITE